MPKIHIVPHFSSCIVNTFINCSSLCFSVSLYRKGKFQIIGGSGCKSVSRNVDLDSSTHPYWSLVAATFYKWRLKTDVFESAPLSGFKCTALTCIPAMQSSRMLLHTVPRRLTADWIACTCALHIRYLSSAHRAGVYHKLHCLLPWSFYAVCQSYTDMCHLRRVMHIL